MSDTDATIRSAKLSLSHATDVFQTTPETTDSNTLDALIQVAERLITVIADQQRQIERLTDALQNHLETTPRRR
ncbi:MAG: hypothetical protein MOB07_26230 [Acidobacteria bacterium]|nr:hypothetical protein [Acidobacteriota bacterium]